MAEIAGFLKTLVGAGQADRYVHIGAQVAILHIAIAGAQIAQDLAQLGHIGGRLFGAANIGAADDLHQRHAGAVQIHKRHGRVHIVDRLACILFKVNPLDPHAAGHARAHIDDNLALAHDGVIKLADLVALRQVWVEIVFAVKGRPKVNLGLQAQPCAHGLGHAEFVDHRQHARHGGIHKGHIGVWLGAKTRRGARKQLGVRGNLGMHLHADHQLPVVLGPCNDLGLGRFKGKIKHRCPLSG